MANTVISLKKSATPFAVPSSLANGEIAINYADGKLFYKNTAGYIAEISGSGGGSGGSNINFAAVNVAGTLIIADTNDDILTITEGDNIILSADAGSDSFSISADLSSATDFANNKFLANTTGTFAGDLTITGNVTVDGTTFYVDTVNNRVGLGTTDPITQLHAYGDYSTLLAQNSSTDQYAGSRLQLKGVNGTNRSTLFTHSNYNVGGSQSYFSIETLDASDSYIETLAAYNYYDPHWAFYVQGNEKLRIDSSGNVGIGTTSMTYKVDVNGSVNAASYFINGTNIVSGYITPAFAKANTVASDLSAANTFLQGYADTAESDAVSTAASYTDSANTFLKGLTDTALSTGQAAFAKANTADTNAINAFGKANTACTKADTAQTTAVAAFGKANTNATNISGANTFLQSYTDTAEADAKAYANSTFLANTTGSVFNGDLAVSGNLAVGTTTTTNFKLEVNGSFAATTKSFVIDHPTKDGKRLRYASLEGPENGVYVRGKLKDENIIELPDYWTGLIDEDSITVNLTPIGSSQNLFVKEVKDNKVFVKSTSKTKPINCYYVVYAERKDVDKLEVEI